MYMGHIWTTACPLYNIFLHYLVNVQFSENIIEHKMRFLIYCTSFVSDISRIKNNWANYDKKYIYVYMSIAVIIIRF